MAAVSPEAIAYRKLYEKRLDQDRNRDRRAYHHAYNATRRKLHGGGNMQHAKRTHALAQLVQGPHRCPICKHRLADQVDHDHTTGDFRGLLCGPCNRAIGSIGESNLTDALLYLSRARKGN